MPYVSVHVNIDEVLSEASDQELLDELNSRRIKNGGGSRNPADYAIPIGVARTALDDASRFLRKAGRVDLAFKLDEIRVDYLDG